jgi:hypothetical protein
MTKNWMKLGVLQLLFTVMGLFAANAAHAQQQMDVSATFDHAYMLRVQGCSVSWQWYAGRQDIGNQRQNGGCMYGDNVQVTVDYPSRIDQIELPSYQNNHTLTVLVVEPLGGSNPVHVHIYSNGDNGGGSGGGNGSGYAYVAANSSVCHANGQQLCTAYLSWSAGGPPGVITVTALSEGVERVWGCGTNGSGSASWIVPNNRYVFKVYNANYCDASVGRFNRPVAQTTIQGLP